jgi:ornithine carbamoyltransferase
LPDFSAGDLRRIIDGARAMKEARKGKPKGLREPGLPLEGRILAMIFEKPSTRTRVSFEVAMRQLGGDVLMIPANDMQLGRGETVADTARVLSRYVDAIMIRTGDHHKLSELAQHATVPVINGLTNLSHPCQIMADVMTFEEHKGAIAGRVLAWIGDGNNVATSFIHAATRFGFELRLACPPELAPNSAALAWAAKEKGHIVPLSDPETAARGADCIIADAWVSMHDKDGENRHNLLKPYQVDQRLMRQAKPDAIFMHCLPAHRGEEMTADVIDGPQSVVFDEAENRLHVQKSILLHCLGGET